MRQIPIALTFDDNYSPIAGVFIQSLIETKKPETKYVIHAFGDKVDPYNRRMLFDLIKQDPNVTMQFVAIDASSYVDALDKDRHMTASTFYRLHLASLLPQYDKVLYLDVDMLCCCDLSELYDLDMEGYVYAAAPEVNHMVGVVSDSWQRSYYCGEHGWPEEKLMNYRQAGVLLLNLEMIRRFNYEARFEELAAKRFKLMDQDILNIAVPSENIRRLHMKWNFVSSFGMVMHKKWRFPEPFLMEFLEAFENPNIIHWAGSSKPWNSVSQAHSMQDRFWTIAQKTPWYSRLLIETTLRVAEKRAAKAN